MSLPVEKKSFAFPKIRQAQLHSFSLYSLQPDVILPFADGVMCLAGANGIGKSTFLATLNYGLSGTVPNPERKFLSGMQYTEDADSFTESFFDGRISESDRDAAAISIDFTIGGTEVSITRGLFNPNDLRVLTVKKEGEHSQDHDDLTSQQRVDIYKDLMCELIGLASFDQFVFLQHFLLTFDESRHLLFWDQSASRQMLHLCFGGDAQMAARADHLHKEMERAASWGRNYQFQVNNLNKRLAVLEEALKVNGGTSVELEAASDKYILLRKALDDAALKDEASDALLNEAVLRVNQASAEVVIKRSAYNEAFNSLLTANRGFRNNPLIIDALHEEKCPICGTVHKSVSENIQKKLDLRHCPLCELAPESAEAVSSVQQSLAQIDAELAKAKEGLDGANEHKLRAENVSKASRRQVLEAQEELIKFEKENKAIIDSIKARAAAQEGPAAKNVEAIREAQNQLIIQRDEAYSQRDKYKEEWRGLQRELEKKYLMAEKDFVPSFRELAEIFLGIDLDVNLVSNQSGIKLELEMRGGSRKLQHQLSESQRFFVDIALRMALAKQVSNDTDKACLFIDTPEGSLDIAYENKAGEMFARFVADGYGVVMTANINSSKLLTTLASQCGSSAMRIVPMTNWTELSDVQRQSSELFSQAYSEITNALNAHVAS